MTLSSELDLAREQQRRMPDFFIVGHAKCGTTALYDMLKRHPQIFLPEYKSGFGKEPWFFSRENPQPQETSERSVAWTGRHGMTVDEYLSRFEDAGAEQVMGEGSTSYLWSETAAARIAQVRPDARIVAIIREPTSFLRSLHLQLLQNHHETERDFRRAVSLDQPRREGREIPANSYWPAALIYSDRVRYVEQLRRYHEQFSREQVLVLIYDDFRRDNVAEVQRVQRFLGVSDEEPVRARDSNPTVWVRSERLRRAVKAAYRADDPVSRATKATLKAVAPTQLRRNARQRLVYGSPPPPDPEFVAELRARFKGEVEALSEYLGRDLVGLWGYDGVQ